MKVVEIHDSWHLSNGLIIAEIAHSFNGLPSDASIYNGKDSWSSATRILFNHTHAQHRIFENENTILNSLVFKNVTAREASAKRILENEAKGIFQYTLKGTSRIEIGLYRVKHDNLIFIAETEFEENQKEYFEFPKYTPAYWAARYGHNISCGDLRLYLFTDKDFEKWCHELFAILHSDDRDELRKHILSPEELKQVEKEIEMGF